MVALFCLHLSNNHVDWSDLDIDLSGNYVYLSDLYVDLSHIHMLKNSTFKRVPAQFVKSS